MQATCDGCLALRPQVVSQALQHFRSSETLATCDGCFARRASLSAVISFDWHVQGSIQYTQDSIPTDMVCSKCDRLLAAQSWTSEPLSALLTTDNVRREKKKGSKPLLSHLLFSDDL